MFASTSTQLFIVLRNLHDIIASQQQQLDLIAESHFKLGYAVRSELGIDPEATLPTAPTQAAIDKAKVDIDELEKLFQKGEK